MNICTNRICKLCLLVLLVFSGAAARSLFCRAAADEARKTEIDRLILTDGTYERISQYEIRGDRVRYFSTERNDWEELPYSMIDWDATARYAGQKAHDASVKTNDALQRAAAERNEEEALTPTIAPGLKIPLPEGVFLLDTYKGVRKLDRLTQTGADLNRNMRSNILRAVLNPVAGSRQTIELAGQHAEIQSHVSDPTIYFAVDPEDPSTGYTAQTASEHLRIVRCEEKNGNRVVAASNIAVYGKVKDSSQYIDAQVTPVSDYWVKVVPAVPLQEGEYALVEFDANGSMNMFVWDFGFNPQAPDNQGVFPSTPEKQAPVLIQKSHKP